MKTITVKLKSISPYSQGRHHATPKNERETDDDHEKRTWRSRMHVTGDGFVYIPPMAIKNCLSEVAKFLGEKIPGKRGATYTKHFESGVMVMDPVILNVKADAVEGEWLFVPSDGRRGGPKRVMKCFGRIPSWEGSAVIHVLDNAITEEVFKTHIDQAGKFIGLGRFRPKNNGYYGRFEVVGVQGF